ncbi:MAG: hypothetical protein ACLFQ8_03170 [Candidatus Aenigmatarchaeota archaeon]
MKFLKESVKGQFSIEYLIAFLLFSIVILYISFQAADVLPQILTERAVSRKDAEAHRITNFLAENEGGLADEPYRLNKTKLNEWKERCDEDYDKTIKMLGLEEISGVQIKRFDSYGGHDICSGPPVPSGVSLGYAVSFGYIQGEEINRLEVVVW